MSGWQIINCAERGECDCFRHEELIRDDGWWLGAVMQFYEDGASYPAGRQGRYGAFDTFDNAKKAVESLEAP